jgi:hypothetical protein
MRCGAQQDPVTERGKLWAEAIRAAGSGGGARLLAELAAAAGHYEGVGADEVAKELWRQAQADAAVVEAAAGRLAVAAPVRAAVAFGQGSLAAALHARLQPTIEPLLATVVVPRVAAGLGLLLPPLAEGWAALRSHRSVSPL